MTRSDSNTTLAGASFARIWQKTQLMSGQRRSSAAAHRRAKRRRITVRSNCLLCGACDMGNLPFEPGDRTIVRIDRLTNVAEATLPEHAHRSNRVRKSV